MDQDKIRKEMEQLIKTRAAKSELEVCEFYHLYLMTLISLTLSLFLFPLCQSFYQSLEKSNVVVP